ncbi:MAG: TetR/AcrR family transcriptional regulator C-terminal domain-containing protein [Wolinella sp.]
MAKSALSKRAIARREKFLEIASEIFLEHGFERASVNEIVKRAGGSLCTLYKLFGNKDALFEAVLEQKIGEMLEELTRETIDWDNIDEALTNFGIRFFDILSSRDFIALSKILISEGNRNNGKIGNMFYQHGQRRTESIVCDYLMRCKDAGKIDIDDVPLAASRFLFLVIEPFYFKSVTTNEKIELDTNERARIVRNAVNIFLYGIATLSQRSNKEF